MIESFVKLVFIVSVSMGGGSDGGGGGVGGGSDGGDGGGAVALAEGSMPAELRAALNAAAREIAAAFPMEVTSLPSDRAGLKEPPAAEPSGAVPREWQQQRGLEEQGGEAAAGPAAATPPSTPSKLAPPTAAGAARSASPLPTMLLSPVQLSIESPRAPADGAVRMEPAEASGASPSASGAEHLDERPGDDGKAEGNAAAAPRAPALRATRRGLYAAEDDA